MSKSTEHRKHAQECRALAHNVQNDEHRAQLLKMAAAWDSFAVDPRANRAATAKGGAARRSSVADRRFWTMDRRFGERQARVEAAEAALREINAAVAHSVCRPGTAVANAQRRLALPEPASHFREGLALISA